MTADPTSLDLLHDIVLPPAVPWWPPAPGWHAVLVMLTLAACWLAWRGWKRRQADGYRRAALRRLPHLQDVPAVAELFRRTALAIAPRSVIAAKTGAAWVDWLDNQCPEPMPPAVRRLLTTGVYGLHSDRNIDELKAYAARWISRHRRDVCDSRGHE